MLCLRLAKGTGYNIGEGNGKTSALVLIRDLTRHLKKERQQNRYAACKIAEFATS